MPEYQEETREMEMDTMEATPERLMELADEADSVEEENMPVLEGDFSLNRINRLVESLNRVNKIFQAPPYPTFEALPPEGVYPPEFAKNLMMVQSAVIMSGMDEYMFDIKEVKTDADVLELAGKLDAIASDKTMKAFLNKPIGTGEFQQEAGVPVTVPPTGGDVKTPNSSSAEADVELFMSRM